MLKEYRLMYNKYDGNGWSVYKECDAIVEIIKSLGVLKTCHPTWRVKIEERTITNWKELKIDE